MPTGKAQPDVNPARAVIVVPSDSETESLRGWVLYDDACGFCRKWVPYWERTLEKRGIGIAPNRSAWVTDALGLKAGETLGDICLLMRDGRRVLGADVYRHVMRRVWWAYPVYLLSVVPLGRWCFNRGYRTFAKNRYRFSKACALPGVDKKDTRESGADD